jgi:chromosome partitioning protein
MDRSLSFMNRKGGSFKTSLAAQVAGLAARSGWHVLVVDMDSQGNLNRDFGTMRRSDDGEGLFRAVRDGVRPVVLSDVRTNLDLIPAGESTVKLYRELVGNDAGVPNAFKLRNVLEPLAAEYDLVIIDSPPGEEDVQQAILYATRFLVCPTRPDEASIDGLTGTARRAVNVRQYGNPSLELLGTVITGVAASATKVLHDAEATINERSGGALKVFHPPIRTAEAAATACRHYGLLVHELELAAKAQDEKLRAEHGSAWWVRLGREERKALRRLPDAKALATDYQQLTDAVLSEIRARLEVAAV